VLPAAIFSPAVVLETRIFRDAPVFSNSQGQDELACPRESSTELAGG
jgi:hypothetical protein